MLIDQLAEVALPLNHAEMRDKFHEYGYVVIRDLLDPLEDLQPLIDEYAALLDRLVTQWHADGEISSTYADLPYEERLIAVIAETGDRVYDHFRIFFNPPSATQADTPLHVGPAIFGLLTNPKLLDALEVLIGPEIMVNPVNVVRVKIPERKLPTDRDFHVGLTATWWHQDQGVYSQDITDIDMITVWLPLTNASKEMGCLQVVPGSHRGDLALHCASRDPRRFGIPELLLGNLRHAVEMRLGDVHFHHRLLQHNSLPNLSDRLRFSFDLRYQPTAQAKGQSAGVPGDVAVPGFIARSKANSALEMRDWQAWAAYQEAMRQQFMAIDWPNTPPQNQFSTDHRYCL